MAPKAQMAMVTAWNTHTQDHDCVQAPIIFSGLTFIVGAAIMAGAVHISMIIMGRLILGLGVGVGTTVNHLSQALHCMKIGSRESGTSAGQQRWSDETAAGGRSMQKHVVLKLQIFAHC